MSQDKIIANTVAEIEDLVDQVFMGPPRAYFEIPNGEHPLRGDYVLYAYKADTDVAALKGMFEGVQKDNDRSHLSCLFWRMEEKVTLRQEEGEWRARTRLVVIS